MNRRTSGEGKDRSRAVLTVSSKESMNAFCTRLTLRYTRKSAKMRLQMSHLVLFSRTMTVRRSLRPQRRNPRAARSESRDLDHVLSVVNGETWTNPELDEARRQVRQVLLGIVEYCDEVRNILDGPGPPDKRIQNAIRRAINPEDPTKKSLAELCRPI